MPHIGLFDTDTGLMVASPTYEAIVHVPMELEQMRTAILALPTLLILVGGAGAADRSKAQLLELYRAGLRETVEIEAQAAKAVGVNDRLTLFKLSQSALKISGRINRDLTLREVDRLPDGIDSCTDASFQLGSLLADVERNPNAKQTEKVRALFQRYDTEIKRCEALFKVRQSSRTLALS